MANVLSGTPFWFVIFMVFILSGCIFLLGGYFLWSMKNIFQDLKQSIESLKELIHQLYDRHATHESRISTIEGRLLHHRKTDMVEE